MSVRRMGEVWDIQFPTLAQKIVTLRIADYSSDEGHSIFPSNNTLATAAQVDERTVRRVTAALRQCGLLELVREGGHGPKSTNHWKLNTDMLKSIADGELALVGTATEITIIDGQPVDKKADMLSALDPIRWTPVSDKVDTGVHQPINKHQKEKTRECAREPEPSRTSRAFRPATIVTPADPQWSAWMAFWQDNDRPDLVQAAQGLGKISASSKWPGTDVRVFEPVASFTNRILGEAAQ